MYYRVFFLFFSQTHQSLFKWQAGAMATTGEEMRGRRKRQVVGGGEESNLTADVGKMAVPFSVHV